MMDKPNTPMSELSPNMQKQIALGREHKKQLARLHEHNFKGAVKPDEEEERER
jgi:hypothetical protein